MKNIKNIILFLSLIVLTNIICSGCYPFIPHTHRPTPAKFLSLNADKDNGQLLSLELAPKRIYALGLTYATHIKETASNFDPNVPPPLFRKDLVSLNTENAPVKIPTRQDLIDCAEKIEPGLGKKLDKEFGTLPSLLDYEGELAFVLLEDMDWQKISDPAYAPKLGYFLANDLSARTIAVLGEGKSNRFDYWSASKSFPGFLPVGKHIWIPKSQEPDSILNPLITTTVNGEIRQKQYTTDMIYTPRQMLLFIFKAYPEALPGKGDVVLMGTPGGVAMRIPPWKTWMADLLSLNRFKRLAAVINDSKRNKKFLKSGDVVEVSGGVLGSVKTQIIP